MSEKKLRPKILSKSFYLSVFTALSIIIICVMWFSYHTGNIMVTTYTPLVDATMEIKVETTNAHLWFEEVLSGDRHEDIEEVWKHIDQAIWYANAILEGDENEEDKFIALNNPGFDKEIKEVIIKIEEFKNITKERYTRKKTAVAGTDIDEQYDAIFRDFISQIDNVENNLQQIINKKLILFKWIQIALILLVSVVIIIFIIIFNRFETKRSQNYSSVTTKNTILEKDIAKWKKAEGDLLKSEQNLKEAQSIALLGRWELNLINNKLIWSDTIFEIFEINKKKFGASYEAFLDAIHPDDREKVNKAYTESLKTKMPYDIEHRLKMNDGSIKHVIEKCRTEYDENGNALKSIGIVQDITERKKTEGDLRENEEKYRSLYENAPLPYQSLNEDGSFKDINPSWLSTLGYERAEVIGKNFADFLHPDWKPHFEQNFPAFKKRGYVNDVQFKIRHKDGSYLDISFEGCIGYSPDGSFKQTYCVFQDITEQKRTEEKLHESLKREKTQADIVRNNPIAIAIGYPDGSLSNCNKAFCDLTGYSEQELQKINWSKVLTPSKWEKLETEELKKLSRDNNYITYEKEYIHKNGSIIPIELKVSATFDDDNNVLHYTGFISDITVRKQSETKINIERDKLTTILESMQDGIYLINKNYDIEYVNPSLIKDFGLPGDKKCHKYFHDSDKPCTFCKNKEVFAGETVQWEWTSPTNGKTYDLIDTPINNSDGSISKLEIFRDITYRKESENKIARFSRIFEDSLNEVYLFDADTLKFTQVNNAAQDNLGYSMDELRNMTPLDFKPEFTAELFAKLVEPLRKGEKQKILFETIHKRKDRSLYNVEVHLQLLQFEKENLFAAFIMDVTERKKAEEELEKHRNHLEDMVAERTEELKEKNQELDNTLKVFVGREYKINELQEKIRVLEGS